MAWKRKPKPLEVDHCCCGQCGGECPDPPSPGLVRCKPCHYGERHGLGTLDENMGWYCTAAGHGDQKCSTKAEHRQKVAAKHAAIVEILREMDHAIDVAQSRKWGQLTFEELT